MSKRPRIKYKDCHKTVNGVEYKLCKECMDWFEMNEDNFKVQPSQKDGYSHRCITCKYNYAHDRYMNNREKEIAKQKKKQDENPEYYKEYNRKRYIEKKDDYFRPLILKHERENKERYQVWTKEWHKNNPEKNKQYAKNHRNHDISSKEWLACQNIFKFKCAYCGKTLEEQFDQNKNRLHKEHVDDKGYNDLRNCVPSCTQCNSTKRKREISELFKSNEIENFIKDKYDFIIWWIEEGYKEYIEDKPPYRIKRSRTYKEDGTYYLQNELWSVDEKRNLVECIATKLKKKDLKEDIEKYLLSLQ